VEDPSGRKALYDLTADPREAKDVAAGHPDVVGRLSGELARHLQRVARPR
jgi:hypothetical protein